MNAESLINKLGGKDGLYSFFEDKNIIMPRKETINLLTLVKWFLLPNIIDSLPNST